MAGVKIKKNTAVKSPPIKLIHTVITEAFEGGTPPPAFYKKNGVQYTPLHLINMYTENANEKKFFILNVINTSNQ